MGKTANKNNFWIATRKEFWLRTLSTRKNPFPPTTMRWLVYALLCGRCYSVGDLYRVIKVFAVGTSMMRTFRDFPEFFSRGSVEMAIEKIKQEGVPIYRVGKRKTRIRGVKGRYILENLLHIPERDADYVPVKTFGLRSPRDRKSRKYLRRMPRRLWLAGYFAVRVDKTRKQARLVWIRNKAKKSRRRTAAQYEDMGRE